jgi:hypothetical protein
MEVAGCGTGIMLIKRETIATMLKTLPGINDSKAKTASPLAAGLDRLIRAFDNIEIAGVPLMDDFAFCHRWHVLCKGEIWARADQAVTHIGLHKFGARYTDSGTSGTRLTLTTGSPAKIAPGQSGSSVRDGKTIGGSRKVAAGRLTAETKGKA